jgi:hypothetical protein
LGLELWFEGAKMPFLVREKVDSESESSEINEGREEILGERFVLVRPCYVEGLSGGEGTEIAKRGEVKVDEILFCWCCSLYIVE